MYIYIHICVCMCIHTHTHNAFHLKVAEYTFLLSVHGTFSRIDHMLSIKQAPVNFRKLKSYQASFPTTML